MEIAIIRVETEEQAAVIKKLVRKAVRQHDTDPQFIEFRYEAPSEAAYQSLLRRLEEHEMQGRINFSFGVQRL